MVGLFILKTVSTYKLLVILEIQKEFINFALITYKWLFENKFSTIKYIRKQESTLHSCQRVHFNTLIIDNKIYKRYETIVNLSLPSPSQNPKESRDTNSIAHPQ